MVTQAIKRGQPIPESIVNAPVLLDGLDLYYDAFSELSSCRDFSMGQGPIPWTAINEYSTRFCIQDEFFNYFVSMIRALDDTYLRHVASKSDKNKPGEPDDD